MQCTLINNRHYGVHCAIRVLVLLLRTRQQVLQLKDTEDRLRQHIRGFKCFQLFVVIAIVLLCVVIILMADKFPAAVSPNEHPKTGETPTTTVRAGQL